MKTRKYRLETLSFYDHTGIEKHLVEMAKKGWMIERISNYYWTYRKVEPQELQFTVTYYPKASEFAPLPFRCTTDIHRILRRNRLEAGMHMVSNANIL